MTKTKVQKKDEVKFLEEGMKGSPSAVLAAFTGVTMAEMQSFRKQAKAKGVTLRVVKNSLVELAVKKLGIEGFSLRKSAKMLMLATGGEDEVAAPKVIHEIGKKLPAKVAIFAGLVNSRMVPLNMLKTLATIPSREELLAKMVGSMNAPISGFVNSLSGIMRGFVQVIKSIGESRA